MVKLHRHTDRGRPVYRRSPEVRIRWATPEDATRIDLLAQLDEAPIPPAPVLLGFVGDELWAAVSLSTGELVAEPFRASAEVAQLVLERGSQLTASEGSGLAGAQAGRVRRPMPRRRSRRLVGQRAS